MPALPSCGSEPSVHFTAELILAMTWSDLDEIWRPGWGEELVIPRADASTRLSAGLVHWLQHHIAVDDWSPGMETQALIVVAGAPLTETWQAADGETWSVEKLLEAVVVRWRENRDEANLKPGDAVPENMLHLAPALIDFFRRYPETILTYGPVLDEVFAAYEGALHPDGYWGFPGETFSTGHIVEQYIRAQEAGINIAMPSLRPVELMVTHQAADGWFDIHNNPYIGAQAHGVRALGVTLPLLPSPSEGERAGVRVNAAYDAGLAGRGPAVVDYMTRGCSMPGASPAGWTRTGTPSLPSFELSSPRDRRVTPTPEGFGQRWCCGRGGGGRPRNMTANLEGEGLAHSGANRPPVNRARRLRRWDKKASCWQLTTTESCPRR